MYKKLSIIFITLFLIGCYSDGVGYYMPKSLDEMNGCEKGSCKELPPRKTNTPNRLGNKVDHTKIDGHIDANGYYHSRTGLFSIKSPYSPNSDLFDYMPMSQTKLKQFFKNNMSNLEYSKLIFLQVFSPKKQDLSTFEVDIQNLKDLQYNDFNIISEQFFQDVLNDNKQNGNVNNIQYKKKLTINGNETIILNYTAKYVGKKPVCEDFYQYLTSNDACNLDISHTDLYLATMNIENTLVIFDVRVDRLVDNKKSAEKRVMDFISSFKFNYDLDMIK